MKNIHHLLPAAFITVIIAASCVRQPVNEILLHDNWKFARAGESKFHKAAVPGCVHTDLIANKLISDPFYGSNEQQVQWVGKSDWKYVSEFDIDEKFLESEHIDLVFEGLDTYATVTLNGKELLKTDNMFRKWVVNCKNLLKPSDNKLIVMFRSPVLIDSIKAATLPYRLPDQRAFTRKAPYQYGWDWGPRLVTMGIWKPVYLRAWKDARIENIRLVQDSVTPDTAYYTAYFEIESSIEQDGFLSVFDDEQNEIINKERYRLKEGIAEYPVTFYIDNPELWWPNGYGKQKLYRFRFLLQTNRSIDIKRRRTGVRTVELVMQPDIAGESFYFKVNGIPVFMKGANYIPQDVFPSRVSVEHYKRLISFVKKANMNILRVWGGGIYEKDLFYDLCDENGILVWQDFMFACNMYPGDSAFLNNVESEAIEQVGRIQHHPSLALWCGNNESDEGWHNWGWQKSLGYSADDSTVLWSAYINIFEKILPGIVKRFSPGISYIPSSPRIGWGHDQALKEGDMHYWGVWWGEEPFEMYEVKVGRFMSEYGFQGFPDIRTLQSCLDSSDLYLVSSALKNHNKHPRGMELIETYMKREYIVPQDFLQYDYVSQLVQAYGVTKAIEAHRRAKPYCMGTLYWQLNDCWPVISWSGIDWFNRPKALHYFVKNTYKPVIVSFSTEQDSLNIFIVSDSKRNYSANLELKLFDFNGGKLFVKSVPVEIKSNTSQKVFSLKTSELISGKNKKQIVLSAKLIWKETLLAGKNHYFCLPKELELPDPVITTNITKTANGYRIVTATEKLAKNVFLTIDAGGNFSDNFFDILPGDFKVVEFFTDKNIENFAGRLRVMTLKDTWNNVE